MTDVTAPMDVETTPGPVPDRYASISLPDGEVVIYDRDESDGWVQSDDPVTMATMR